MGAKRLYIVLLLLFSGGMAAAQSGFPNTKADFFRARALSDAKYEIHLQFKHDRDELDFWKDQRQFENRLRDRDPEGYFFYLKTKREAYAAHKPLCAESCQHGDYYHLQASYYFQYGALSSGVLSKNDRIQAVSSNITRSWQR